MLKRRGEREGEERASRHEDGERYKDSGRSKDFSNHGNDGQIYLQAGYAAY